jgi:hypothetical protein
MLSSVGPVPGVGDEIIDIEDASFHDGTGQIES